MGGDVPGGRLNDSVGRHSPGPVPPVNGGPGAKRPSFTRRLMMPSAACWPTRIPGSPIRPFVGEVLHVFRVSVRNNPRIDAVDIDEHVVRGGRNGGHR